MAIAILVVGTCMIVSKFPYISDKVSGGVRMVTRAEDRGFDEKRNRKEERAG